MARSFLLASRLLIGWSWRMTGWRGAVRAAALAAAGILATTLLVGADAWPSYLAAMSNASPTCSIADGFQSLRCSLTPAFGAGTAQLIAFGVGGALALLALFTPDRRIGFAVLAFAAIISSPDLNWPYWLVPLIGILPAVARLTDQPI